MINIRHPRIQSKPPTCEKHVARKNFENAKEDSLLDSFKGNTVIAGEAGDPWVDSTNAFSPETKFEKDFKSGNYARNSFETAQTTIASFEQLCSVISDLEKNITNEITEITTKHGDVPAPEEGCTTRARILQLQPEKDEGNEIEGKPTGISYNDIMRLLESLEGDSFNEIEDHRIRSFSVLDIPMPGETWLDTGRSSRIKYNRSSEKIEDDRSSRRISKEQFVDVQLRIEEKDATISLLKNQLKTERKTVWEKLDTQKRADALKLSNQEEKYKGMVKRHQKFIEQLISEKTDLTEKCKSLAERAKQMELKFQRDLKAATDRHSVELQRAKEHYAAAEKIRRERWLEARTLKIKEMTVKGLEPELRGMLQQHEAEIEKLRILHRKELQDAELRAISRADQQLQQLRLELTTSHEQMLINEKDILCARYKEELEEREARFEAQRIKLEEELDREKLIRSEEQTKLASQKEATLNNTHKRYQEELDNLRKHHLLERKTTEETLTAMWKTWVENYKREQTTKLEKAEKKIKDDCVMERDLQIELAIARVEKDARGIRLTLQREFDQKYSLAKAKYDVDLQTALDRGKLLEDKLAGTLEKLERTERELHQAQTSLQECLSNLNIANEHVKNLIAERDNAKKIARFEIESEKRELEEKIASLYREMHSSNADRDAFVSRLPGRLKFIMDQNILAMKKLAMERDDVTSKCDHLEKLLDQQRKEYVLRAL